MGVAKSGYRWQLAPSLISLETEADRIAPRRSRVSDGSIGDPNHSNRISDHNPSGGFVHAIDITPVVINDDWTSDVIKRTWIEVAY